MKKLIIILLMMMAISCQKQTTCVVTSVIDTFRPCEGFPVVNTYITDGDLHENGVIYDTICYDNKPCKVKITTKCN
jgi:hypothetical protein